MPISRDNMKDILSTRLFNRDLQARQRLKETREMRIREAIQWEAGQSLEETRRYVVNVLSNDIEVYFLKPGKEAFRDKPNIHDMTPKVSHFYENARFDDIWVYLSKISAIDFDLFKMVMVLIYRNAHHIDHKEETGKIRYRPNENVMVCIEQIQEEINNALPDGGLLGLLNFLDILGWNEDVKYHTENNLPTFSGRHEFKTGRINTLLTCIRVPFQMSLFIKNIIDNANNPNRIDFRLGYEIMQQFAKSRGTCTPTNGKLVEWLSPYIIM